MTRERSRRCTRAQPGGRTRNQQLSNLDRDQEFLWCSLEKTLQAVFKSVKIHTARFAANVYYVASDRGRWKFSRQPSGN